MSAFSPSEWFAMIKAAEDAPVLNPHRGPTGIDRLLYDSPAPTCISRPEDDGFARPFVSRCELRPNHVGQCQSGPFRWDRNFATNGVTYL